jgi:AcrR family transcriptional regulator
MVMRIGNLVPGCGRSIPFNWNFGKGRRCVHDATIDGPSIDVYTVYVMSTKAQKSVMAPPEPTRDRIFAAARALFDAEGLAGLSMRKIAATVDITPMAIYRHYADKDALIDALMLDGFAVWEARVCGLSMRDPLRWLLGLMDAFADFALLEPRRYEAAFLLPARKARRFPDDFAAGRSPAISMAYARIEEAKAKGLLGGAPATEIALTLSALGQGLVSMYQAGRFIGEAQFRAAYRTAMRHCLKSFGGEMA